MGRFLYLCVCVLRIYICTYCLLFLFLFFAFNAEEGEKKMSFFLNATVMEFFSSALKGRTLPKF